LYLPLQAQEPSSQSAQDSAADIEFLPRSLVALQAFTWEAAHKSAVVELVNRSAGDLAVSGHETDGAVPWKADIEETEAGQRFNVTVSFRPDAKAGMSQTYLTVKTNKGDVRLPVLTFLKPRVFTVPPELDIGVIDLKSLGRSPALSEYLPETLNVYRAGTETFEIEASSSLGFLKIEKTPAEGPGVVHNVPGQGATAIFDLVVIPVIDQLQPGPFDGVIRIKTNDTEFPELNVRVWGSVVQ
jgi:hypothetical protein